MSAVASAGTAFGLVFVLILVVTAIGLGVYHLLVFPNLDGVAQDLSWYNYDDQSQHFLYWFGFWSIILFGGILSTTKATTRE